MTKNLLVIDKWYAAIKATDVKVLREITAPDVYAFWNGDATVIPWAGRHDGVEAVMAFFSTIGKHLDVLSIQAVDRFETAGAVTIVLDGHWRSKATGRDVRARAANIFRICDGVIAGYEVYPDSGRFVVALAAR